MGRPAATLEDADKRFWSKVRRSGECWEWTGSKHARGYGLFHPLGRRSRAVLAHRYAWERDQSAAIPSDGCICHRCDNPPCVKPEHLFLGTQTENMADMNAKGRHAKVGRKGSSNGNAVLREADIPNIKESRKSGMSIASIARQYKVSWSAIERVVKGRSWL